MNKEIEKAIETLIAEKKRQYDVLDAIPLKSRDRAIDICNMIKACEFAITALEAQKADMLWIPVTERLPTNCQRLMVFNKSGNLYLSRYICNEFIDIEYNAFHENQENTISDVVEWRPLPTHGKEVHP